MKPDRERLPSAPPPVPPARSLRRARPPAGPAAWLQPAWTRIILRHPGPPSGRRISARTVHVVHFGRMQVGASGTIGNRQHRSLWKDGGGYARHGWQPSTSFTLPPALCLPCTRDPAPSAHSAPPREPLRKSRRHGAVGNGRETREWHPSTSSTLPPARVAVGRCARSADPAHRPGPRRRPPGNTSRPQLSQPLPRDLSARRHVQAATFTTSTPRLVHPETRPGRNFHNLYPRDPAARKHVQAATFTTFTPATRPPCGLSRRPQALAGGRGPEG